MKTPHFIAGLIFLSLVSCQQRKPLNDVPVVTVTIAPFSFFAGELAGDRFKINVLVPPGSDHHSYDPAPRQMKDLEQSEALFINGHLGFEQSWVPKFRDNYPDLTVIDLSEDLELITEEAGEGHHGHPEGEISHAHDDAVHHHEGVEPHYWLSPRVARQLASNMAGGLILADPSSAQRINTNLERLLQRIDSLDRDFTTRLAGLQQRSFIIFHPALTYLARDYGLVQIPMELGGKEPSAAHLKNLVNEAKNGKINTIFVQREYDRENAETLAREIGAKIVVIDPMSADWLAEMNALLDKLVAMDE